MEERGKEQFSTHSNQSTSWHSTLDQVSLVGRFSVELLVHTSEHNIIFIVAWMCGQYNCLWHECAHGYQSTRTQRIQDYPVLIPFVCSTIYIEVWQSLSLYLYLFFSTLTEQNIISGMSQYCLLMQVVSNKVCIRASQLTVHASSLFLKCHKFKMHFNAKCGIMCFRHFYSIIIYTW